MNLTSVNEVLTFAIRKEADAAAFYRMAAERSNPGVKKAFEELAREEDGHKKKLEALDLKKLERVKMKPAEGPSQGMGIAEMFSDVPYSSDMSYAELLRMAIKNEVASHTLYTSAAGAVSDPGVKKVLLAFAKEESKHKMRLEKIYDEDVLQEF
jgi:erythrin-vacuolar iron transport family protein